MILVSHCFLELMMSLLILVLWKMLSVRTAIHTWCRRSISSGSSFRELSLLFSMGLFKKVAELPVFIIYVTIICMNLGFVGLVPVVMTIVGVIYSRYHNISMDKLGKEQQNKKSVARLVVF